MSLTDKLKNTIIPTLFDKETEQLLLSHPDLVALTGCKRVGSMIGWLNERGWVFEQPNKRGQVPCVSRLYFLQRMGVALNVTPQSTVAKIELQKPRLDFLKSKK